MTNRVFHVISNTHWDREWRFPYQRNRQMLVDMLDEVLHILDTEPDYKAYHLDSQSVMVTDYLEARPHKKEQLIRLVREKRLLIGPWYTLPDEYMAGGENLIRNLLRGIEICEKHGGASRVGYSPFSWGQISQLPQIYREFGISLIMFYRGINSLDSPKAEFIWEGADGTRSLSSRFSTWPRYNFYFYVYRPVVHGEQPGDIEYKWGGGGTPFHLAGPDDAGDDYFMTKSRNGYTPENIREAVGKIIRDQADDFTTRHVIWMEGHDSSGPNRKTVQLLRDIRKEFPELDVRHSTLEEYAQLLAEEADPGKLPVVTGERRSSQYDHRSANLYGYALSARMYLKQANFDAERRLQYYAEPLNSLMGAAGLDVNDRYPEMAWDLLLQNAAHDSIGGCSLDPIHEDMMARYRQSCQISDGIFHRAARYLSGRIALGAHPPDSIHLVILNTTQYTRSEVVEAMVDVPREQDTGRIRLVGPDGSHLPIQLIRREEVRPILEQPVNRPLYIDMIRYHLHVQSPEIPSMGFQTVVAEPVGEALGRDSRKISSEDSKTSSGDAAANPGIIVASEFNGIRQLENSRIRIRIHANGTFDITDKERAHTLRNQGWLYDEGEAGHAWVHTPIGPFVDTLDARPECVLIENGPLSAAVAIKHTLSLLPTLQSRKDALEKSQAANHTKSVDVPVDIRLTLRAGSSWPEIAVTVDNRVESHRLRIMFPLGFRAEHSWGEGQFDVVKRPVDRISSKEWVEQPMYDYPMHHFVDVADRNGGMAILVDGLKEYEVLHPDDIPFGSSPADSKAAETVTEDINPAVNDSDLKNQAGNSSAIKTPAGPRDICEGHILAITLLRSFEYRIPLASEVDYSGMKGTQCLGRQHYRMAVYPHAGDWHEGGVFEQAIRFNYGLRLFQSGRSDGDIKPGTSFLGIRPDALVFSALKKAEGAFVDEQGRSGSQEKSESQDQTHPHGSYVLRIYNPTDQPVDGEITFHFPVRRALQVTMEEKHICDLEVINGRTIKVQLSSRKIMSILLDM